VVLEALKITSPEEDLRRKFKGGVQVSITPRGGKVRGLKEKSVLRAKELKSL